METTTVRPGLLVSLKTRVYGGVDYQRVDLEAPHITERGSKRARWETKREILEPQEFEKASDARYRAGYAIRAICCASDFGLLCPADREQQLNDAIATARQIVEEHNRTARQTFVNFGVLVGRIAEDDEEAERAIRSEVRGLIEKMEQGIAAANPAAIREAADRARELGAMLSEESAGKVTAAIAEARSAARRIVKRVEQEAEGAALIVAEIKTEAIKAARFSFLDFDEAEMAVEVEINSPELELTEV